MSGVLVDFGYALGLSEIMQDWSRQLTDMRRNVAEGGGENDGIAWDLDGCCEIEETVFLAFYGGYIVVFFLLYSTVLLKPMRLLAVFVHEFGHASICWLTGGSVKKIEVYQNEGGVTGYTGGCRYVLRWKQSR